MSHTRSWTKSPPSTWTFTQMQQMNQTDLALCGHCPDAATAPTAVLTLTHGLSFEAGTPPAFPDPKASAGFSPSICHRLRADTRSFVAGSISFVAHAGSAKVCTTLYICSCTKVNRTIEDTPYFADILQRANTAALTENTRARDSWWIKDMNAAKGHPSALPDPGTLAGASRQQAPPQTIVFENII